MTRNPTSPIARSKKRGFKAQPIQNPLIQNRLTDALEVIEK
ncbi:MULTISPECIES: hypothetical protein [Oscillatoriales]|nr:MULTISPECIES: hypothetical protein [Oscillatoriales]